MTRPVIEIDDDEWVTIAWKRQREKCCDCGLEHDVDYRVEDGKLQFRAPPEGVEMKNLPIWLIAGFLALIAAMIGAGLIWFYINHPTGL